MRKSMSKTYIHINQGVLASNRKHGTHNPAITVKNGKDNTYAHEVEIMGPSKVIYSSEGTILSCGARCVVETESPVNVIR